jgi:hypothetical protein
MSTRTRDWVAWHDQYQDGSSDLSGRSLPQFCAPGATVLWSRGQQLPDITNRIRKAFTEAGFEETAFHKPEDATFQIGVARYQGLPQQLQPARLFTFVK